MKHSPLTSCISIFFPIFLVLVGAMIAFMGLFALADVDDEVFVSVVEG